MPLTRPRGRSLTEAEPATHWLWWIVVSLLLLATVPAGAALNREDEARRRLLAAEQLKAQQAQLGKDASERALRAAGEAVRLGRQRVQAAAKLQEAEAALQEVAERIDTLASRRREAERRLAERAASLRPLLPLIQRLSLYPMETLLALPGEPEDALRGLLVLKGLSRTIEADAEALKRDQT